MIIPQLREKPNTAVRGRQVPIADTRAVSPALGGIGRYWRFMALVFAACVVATTVYVTVVPPKWEASAHILLTAAPDDADLSGLGLVSGSVEPARSLQTAIALLDTPAAEGATAATLGAPWSPASVDQSIVLEPLGQSYVVEVTAQADSPSAAAQLATTYVESALATRNSDVRQRAAALIAQRASLPAGMRSTLNSATRTRLELIARTGDPSLLMAQPAVPPSSPVGLPAQYKIALSAVLGLCLAITGAWVRACRARPDDGLRAPAHLPDDDGWDK